MPYFQGWFPTVGKDPLQLAGQQMITFILYSLTLITGLVVNLTGLSRSIGQIAAHAELHIPRHITDACPCIQTKPDIHAAYIRRDDGCSPAVHLQRDAAMCAVPVGIQHHAHRGKHGAAGGQRHVFPHRTAQKSSIYTRWHRYDYVHGLRCDYG